MSRERESTPIDWLRSCWRWYRAGAFLDDPSAAPALRRCTACARDTYGQGQACPTCRSTAVTWRVHAVASGAEQDLASLRAAAHRVRIGAWLLGALVAFLLLRAGGHNVIFLPMVLAAAAGAQVAIVGRMLRTRSDVASRPVALMTEGDLERIADELVAPFFERGLAPAETAEEVIYHPLPDRPARVFVTVDEADLFKHALRTRGVVVGDQTPMREILVSCAVLLDRLSFRRRVRALVQAGHSVVCAYAVLSPTDERWLPHLEELTGRAKWADLLDGLANERERIRRIHFERDIEARSGLLGVRVSMDAVDQLTGFAFEELVAMIYEAKGYRIEPTPKSRDQGADVVAVRPDERLVIQVKHRANPWERSESNEAVQEVVAARAAYRGSRSFVLTNNARFSDDAQRLARTNSVDLLARPELENLLAEFHRMPKDYARLARILATVRAEHADEAD